VCVCVCVCVFVCLYVRIHEIAKKKILRRQIFFLEFFFSCLKLESYLSFQRTFDLSEGFFKYQKLLKIPLNVSSMDAEVQKAHIQT
jgi:hypothetical protein